MTYYNKVIGYLIQDSHKFGVVKNYKNICRYIENKKIKEILYNYLINHYLLNRNYYCYLLKIDGIYYLQLCLKYLYRFKYRMRGIMKIGIVTLIYATKFDNYGGTATKLCTLAGAF